MKRIALLMISVLIVTGISAQTKTGLSGTVNNSTGEPFASATIQLIKASDSSLVKVTTSNMKGAFEFENLPQGNYLLLVSAAGHAKSYSPVIEVAAGSTVIQAPVVVLKPQSKDLKEVTVVARKPLIEQKIDRTVVNVDAFVTNAGANALEVLEKAPGVQVDKDGNISLKGKQGVIVMMDGRPTYVSGADLANLLKGMQASQLEQIEIMTNPPAKYDAAGNSGIINIKTKKNKMKGFNGNASAGAGQGSYFKTNESLSLNYRDGKINLFSNYSFSRNNGYQELDIYRRYKNDDGSTDAIFEQVTFMKTRRMNNNLKIGMDYYLTNKTTLGVVVSGFHSPESTLGVNTSYLKSPESVTDSIVYATSYIRETWKNGSVNFNVRHQYDSTGRELTADADYIKYRASNDQHFVNTTFSPSWVKKYDEQLRGDLPVDIDIYSAKVDYTHPLKKNAKLEMGWKSSYVTTDSRANYFELLNSEWQNDYGKTNFFDYKENINAAYLNINKQLNEKWGVQAGLRYENTNLRGHQYGNPQKGDSSFNRSYNSLFPTIYISYKAAKDHQFGISYGRRIDRPAYQDMNPFLFFLDKYTYAAGNPFLKPQYSNNFELTHIFKSFLTTTANYSITKDMFMETFDQSGYSTIVRQGNIGRRENAGISISANVPVGKWLTAILYTNYNYNKFTGKLYGDDIKVEAGNFLISLNNQIRIDPNWSAEVSGWARTKGIEGQILLKPMGQLNAGVSRQVLKGKGSVRVNVRDIFYTQLPKGEINFKNTEARFTNRRDNRVVNVTFTYRFGKPLKNGNGQRKKGGAGDEQNRVKVSQ
jgi:iron complex outermembrane recepter protein